DLIVLLQSRTRRQQVVGSEPFPLDGRVSIVQQRLEQLLVDALAIGAIGHDQDAVAGLVEADRIVMPAFVVAFFEERLAVWRPVESPAETVAEANSFVLG